MAIIIPKMFTDASINNEIVKLNRSISKCNHELESLDKEIFSLEEKCSRERESIDWHYQTFAPRSKEDVCRVELTYCKENREKIAEISGIISQKESHKKTLTQQKEEYDAQKRELEALLPKTEEQRAEEHYQRLLKAKDEALTEEKYQNIAKQFIELNGYKNAAELAIDCNTQGRMIKERKEEQERSMRYDRVVMAMQRASTEEAYQDVAKQLLEWNGYKNAAELARVCNDNYRILKEQREEQERVFNEECEKQERIEAKKRRVRNIFGVVLGGIVGGAVFALFSVIIKNVISPDNMKSVEMVFAIIIGILGFIMGISEYGLVAGCGSGCVGLIFGAITPILLVALFSGIPNIATISIGVVLGALIGGWRASIPPTRNKPHVSHTPPQPIDDDDDFDYERERELRD